MPRVMTRRIPPRMTPFVKSPLAVSRAMAVETAKGEFTNGIILGGILLVITLGINFLVQVGLRSKD